MATVDDVHNMLEDAFEGVGMNRNGNDDEGKEPLKSDANEESSEIKKKSHKGDKDEKESSKHRKHHHRSRSPTSSRKRDHHRRSKSREDGNRSSGDGHKHSSSSRKRSRDRGDDRKQRRERSSKDRGSSHRHRKRTSHSRSRSRSESPPPKLRSGIVVKQRSGTALESGNSGGRFFSAQKPVKKVSPPPPPPRNVVSPPRAPPKPGGGGPPLSYRGGIRRLTPSPPPPGVHFSKRPLIRPDPSAALPPEEVQIDRDLRTVFCQQLSPRIREVDLREFFSSVGDVSAVRLICDPKTGRSKGISYVEFENRSAVELAMELNGEKLLGYPIKIQSSAELAIGRRPLGISLAHKSMAGLIPTGTIPLKLYVGNLHMSITDEMLRSIFEPFGRIVGCNVIYDDRKNSKGFGFVTFTSQDDALKALAQMNGFEIAGRPIKVNHVTDKAFLAMNPFAALTSPANAASLATAYGGDDASAALGMSASGGLAASAIQSVNAQLAGLPGGFGSGGGGRGGRDGDGAGQGGPNLDTDDKDRMGIQLTATAKLQLMARLAQGSGMKLPAAAAEVLGSSGGGALAGGGAGGGVPSSTSKSGGQTTADAVAAARQLAETAKSNRHTNDALQEPHEAPIATPCFCLSEMFDPAEERRRAAAEGVDDWTTEIRDDVVAECEAKHYGRVTHSFVDADSADGRVYLRLESVSAAQAAVNGFHGRFFGQRRISAAYVPLQHYLAAFPDATHAN